MMLSAVVPAGVSPSFIEAGLTAIAVGAAFAWPRAGALRFAQFEKLFARLARRRRMAAVAVGLTCFLLRLALLPLCPMPQPFVPDDFSFLLAADTFASGRLTNPTPAMWTHFESFHINMTPTYMSMYFPAQGLVLAAGKVFMGQAWFGLLVVTSLLCAALCWMLQAWIPATWALLGGVLGVLHLGLFSYWINTYSGGGAVAALGGALVMGALPRCMRTLRLRHCFVLAVGVVTLALSRPYEGLLLCLPVGAVLAHWLLFGEGRPAPGLVLRRAAVPLALMVGAAAWMAHYDARVNGNPLTLPYTLNRAAYSIAPYWIWQPPRPEPQYRHPVMRDFYEKVEMPAVKRVQTPAGLMLQIAIRLMLMVRFFAGFALAPLLLMLPRVARDRRMRFIAVAGVLWAAGMAIQTSMLPHYLAPFTAALYVIGLQCARHLRVWNPGGKPVGLAMMRLIVVVCIAMAAMRAGAESFHLRLSTWPDTAWNFDWYGPGPLGAPRARVLAGLEGLPGRQLVIVRYAADHLPANEWVYNAADVDASKVVWAREMGAADNREIVRFYHDRRVWLVEPDAEPVRVSSYPLAELEEIVAR